MKSLVGGIGLLVLVLGILATDAHAQGCGILVDRDRFASDFDCDGIADEIDNCPQTPNSVQRDINRNNVGDACDLLIEEIIVNPDNRLRQGEFAHVTVRLMNNHGNELRDVTINVRNRELGIDAERDIAFIPGGETASADFWLKIPKCARPQSYPLSVTASFSSGSATGTETESETLVVERGEVCGTANTSLENTIINVFDRLDVDRGEDRIIPVSITNLGDDQATYDLTVDDLGNWGTWRIDPAQRMRLSAGQRDTAYLYLQVEENAQPGERKVVLSVISGGQRTRIPVSTYVRAPAKAQQAQPPLALILQILFLLLVLALIVAVVIIALRQGKGKGPQSGGDTPRAETRIETTTVTKKSARKTVAVEKADEPKLETYY